MEEVILRVGLPVKCNWSDCPTEGRVKPKEYDGWYKSKLLRNNWKKKWFCPEHYEQGRALDNRFYENFRTPDPYPEDTSEKELEELYAILD